MEIDYSFLVGSCLADFHCLPDIDILIADNEIVNGQDREFNFISFAVIWQFNIGSEALGNEERLSIEANISLLTGPEPIVGFAPASVTSCDGRVM